MKTFLRSLLFSRHGTFKWCLFGSVYREYDMVIVGEFLTPFPWFVCDFLARRAMATDFLPYRDYLNSDKLEINSPSYDGSYELHKWF